MLDREPTSYPTGFVNRELELDQLERVRLQPGPQLVTLWGRRRVGKSTLLSRFAAGQRAVYLYGTRLTEADILQGLAFQAADAFQDEYLREAPFPSWTAALGYFAARAREERLLVIFDEFPYLCEASPGLDTVVQRWWDSLPSTHSLLLILAGSGFSFMEGLTGARGALHGRRTGQVEVHPFDYFDAARFFPGLDPADRIRAYACYGGIPAYLRHWDPARTRAENVRATLLSPGHVLFREAEELLRTEFHQEALYGSILRAVAGGEERPSDIARAIGRHSADEIFDHLRRLIELRFLRREVPVTDWDRLRSRRVLYRLADPYLRFWFRYVSRFQSLLQLGRAGEIWTREIAPGLDEFVARTTWEDVCIQHLWRRVRTDPDPPRFTHLGRWWDDRTEIDLLGLWGHQVTVIGECKWTGSPLGERDLVELQQKARRLPLVDPPLWVLASRSGFDPALWDRAARDPDLLLLEPADLFAE